MTFNAERYHVQPVFMVIRPVMILFSLFSAIGAFVGTRTWQLALMNSIADRLSCLSFIRMTSAKTSSASTHSFFCFGGLPPLTVYFFAVFTTFVGIGMSAAHLYPLFRGTILSPYFEQFLAVFWNGAICTIVSVVTFLASGAQPIFGFLVTAKEIGYCGESLTALGTGLCGTLNIGHGTYLLVSHLPRLLDTARGIYVPLIIPNFSTDVQYFKWLWTDLKAKGYVNE